MLMAAACAVQTYAFDVPMSLVPTQEEFSQFTIRGGMKNWVISTDCMLCEQSGTVNNNAWAFIPVTMSAGTYEVALEIKSGKTWTDQKIGIFLSPEADADADMTAIKDIVTDNTDFTTFAETFTTEMEGNLWLAIHCTSAKSSGGCYVRNITLSASTPAVVPTAPAISKSAITNLAYTATVTMPEVDTNGNALEGNMSLVVTVDGTTEETRTALAPGADVDIALTLAKGEHTIGYTAVMGDYSSETVSEEVEAKEPVGETPTLPFMMEASAENFARCHTIDGNGDGESGKLNGIWAYNADKNAFQYMYHSRNAANDWFFLPLVNFERTIKAKISFEIMTMSYTENLAVYLGREQTAAAMTIPVVKKEDYTAGSWTPIEVEVDLPESSELPNNYTLGFHAYSSADQGYIWLNNIKIESLEQTTGIENVSAAAADTPVEYFDLRGVRVANPQPGTLVIVRQGSSATKTIIR